MKRGIITNKGLGIHISDGEVWMTTWELVDYLYEFMENHTCHLLRGNREEYMLTHNFVAVLFSFSY